MKKILLLSLMLIVVFASTSLYAAEKYSLGNSNIALKVDYIQFSDDVFNAVDLENGVYLGLEGYYGIMPNLYLGLEAGWAGTKNDGRVNLLGSWSDVKTNVNYVPIELNLKYAIDLSPQLVTALGGGLAYNWFALHLDVDDQDADKAAWVFGGQLFADITYKMSKQWFIGINTKYQWTEKLDIYSRFQDIHTNIKADNWRLGAQVGMMF